MEKLHLLGVALGLASLAGVNLYLTVFVTGLAIQQHWIVLGTNYQSLEVLAHPAVLVVAGALYLLEFLADKIPWVDSAWDAVHTIVRPIGAALLAIQVLGHPSPALTVVAALLAGGTALMTHTAKATTRLFANSSPEPFSNIALSLGEDVGVLGGLALLHFHPAIALGVFAALIAAFLYFAPKLLRAMRVKIWLILRKLNSPAASREADAAVLPETLPARLAFAFDHENLLGDTIAWAVPCISGRARRIPANLFGAIVATKEDPQRLYFVARKGWRTHCAALELAGYRATREPRFLSDNLLLEPETGSGPRYLFVFERARSAQVEQIVESLRQRLSTPSPEPAPAMSH